MSETCVAETPSIALTSAEKRLKYFREYYQRNRTEVIRKMYSAMIFCPPCQKWMHRVSYSNHKKLNLHIQNKLKTGLDDNITKPRNRNYN